MLDEVSSSRLLGGVGGKYGDSRSDGWWGEVGGGRRIWVGIGYS